MQVSAPDGCTMSRRKQAKPQHIDSEEPASGGNGEFYARQKVRFAETKKIYIPKQNKKKRAKVDAWVSATPFCAAAAFQRKLWGFGRTLTCWCRLEFTRLELGVIFKHIAGVWVKDWLWKWPTLAPLTSRDGEMHFSPLFLGETGRKAVDLNICISMNWLENGAKKISLFIS